MYTFTCQQFLSKKFFAEKCFCLNLSILQDKHLTFNSFLQSGQGVVLGSDVVSSSGELVAIHSFMQTINYK